MDEPEPLDDATREALSRLDRTTTVTPGLEDRVVAELRERGLLADGRRGARGASRRQLAAAALALATGLGGFGAGARWGTAPAAAPAVDATAAGGRYLLLLREGAAYDHPADAAAHAARVAEYAGWARGLARAGILEAGEELAAAGTLLEPGGGARPAADGESVGGFFLLRAGDDARALALARDCPHLRHGGKVEVRRIRE